MGIAGRDDATAADWHAVGLHLSRLREGVVWPSRVNCASARRGGWARGCPAPLRVGGGGGGAEWGELRVGRWGWIYRHWRGRFYPERLPVRRWLEHYAAHFDTVEVNNSFYRLPSEATFADWAR